MGFANTEGVWVCDSWICFYQGWVMVYILLNNYYLKLQALQDLKSLFFPDRNSYFWCSPSFLPFHSQSQRRDWSHKHPKVFMFLFPGERKTHTSLLETRKHRSICQNTLSASHTHSIARSGGIHSLTDSLLTRTYSWIHILGIIKANGSVELEVEY